MLFSCLLILSGIDKFKWESKNEINSGGCRYLGGGGGWLSLLLDDDADVIRLNSVGDVAGTPHKRMNIHNYDT